MSGCTFYQMVPGEIVPNDWHGGRIPSNMVVGRNAVIDSSFTFLHYRSQAPVGLRIGNDVTIWRSSLSVGAHGTIEIGDLCYIANAQLVCHERITLGSGVMIANGVTIADSDFHPLEPAARIVDSVALSPAGDRTRRPAIEARPIVIEDDVWIGFGATVLKGVRVGAGAIIQPGAFVTRDVSAGVVVAGNPARPVEDGTS